MISANLYTRYVTVPARGANCSVTKKVKKDTAKVTVPARGANCSADELSETGDDRLQSPQGARIVAIHNMPPLDAYYVTVPARGANCSYNYVEIL